MGRPHMSGCLEETESYIRLRVDVVRLTWPRNEIGPKVDLEEYPFRHRRPAWSAVGNCRCRQISTHLVCRVLIPIHLLHDIHFFGRHGQAKAA